jgi:hypothetical protein
MLCSFPLLVLMLNLLLLLLLLPLTTKLCRLWS